MATMDDIEEPNLKIPKDRGDADRLRVALETELKSDRWKVGDQLPTERELGDQYGMARNTVRRALDALEVAQLVVRHVGRGTFKAAAFEESGPIIVGLDAESDTLSPADVIECRLLFEPGLAALVVARASQTDFDRMGECIKKMSVTTSIPEFELWDAEFHDAIAKASRNDALISVARSLSRVRRQSEWGQLKAQKMTPQRIVRLRREHDEIYDALRARDKDRAREALRDHILHIQGYLFE